MNQRQAFTETVELAIKLKMPALEGSPLGLRHLIDMQRRIVENPDYSEAKVGRWLGWAQCALVAANVGATLDDMKQINMRWSDGRRELDELLANMTPHQRWVYDQLAAGKRIIWQGGRRGGRWAITRALELREEQKEKQ